MFESITKNGQPLTFKEKTIFMLTTLSIPILVISGLWFQYQGDMYFEVVGVALYWGGALGLMSLMKNLFGDI